MSNFDRGAWVDAIYKYFQKAFDKVNHWILQKEIENLDGFLGKFVSYLKNRRHCVTYRG